MVGEKRYTRIPPESTGDRVYMIHTAEIHFENQNDGSYAWKVGERYTISGNSGPTMIVHLHGVQDNGTTGILAVHYAKADRINNVEPVAGQTITDPDGSTVVATTTSDIYDMYIPAQNVMGYDNPEYGWNIDRFGSGQMTFAEGQPQLDAFGKLRTSGATIIGDYVFANSTLPSLFSTKLVGGATVTWDANPHALLLSNTTASGDLVAHTSNTYHHYIPGSSHTFMGTVAMSAGETGLTRYWGMFDSQDGFMFAQIDGSFGVQVRSNVTGSVTNTFIAQADFNKDTCDGSLNADNPSGFGIDLTKDNIYWFDVQWLGAGRTRFGCYSPQGERIVMHEIEHANSSPTSVTTTGSLPVCYVQRNTSTIGSTAEFRAFCAAVYTESDVDVQSLGRTALSTFDKTIPSGSNTSDYVYVGTLAPAKEITPGNPNRTLYWPTNMNIMAFDTVTGEDVRCEIEVYANPVLSGVSFSAVEQFNPNNTVVLDTSATDYGGGVHVFAHYLKGDTRINLIEANDSMFNGAFKNFSENGGTVSCNIASITSSTNAVLTIDTAQHPVHRHREGEPLTLTGITGTMSALNGTDVYFEITSLTTANLYTDAALLTPLDTSSYDPATDGKIVGDYGSQLYYTVRVKPITTTGAATVNDIAVKFMLSWKEITQ